jgi:hypothetical protein
VRDEKMLEKLGTHDVNDDSELFSPVDKYARVAEGCAWHSLPTLEARKASKADAVAQSSSKNKNRKKKKSNNNKKLRRLSCWRSMVSTSVPVKSYGTRVSTGAHF